jgi:hypothetical protein
VWPCSKNAEEVCAHFDDIGWGRDACHSP